MLAWLPNEMFTVPLVPLLLKNSLAACIEKCITKTAHTHNLTTLLGIWLLSNENKKPSKADMKVEAQKANWAYDKHEFKKMQSPQRLICEMKAQIALSCRQMVGSQPLLYWHVMFPSVCVLAKCRP